MLPQYHSLLAGERAHCAGPVTGLPLPALRHYSAGYAGFRADADASAIRRRLLPLTLTTVIIDLDGVASLVTGPRSTPAVSDQATWRHGVAVGLTPAGVPALLGVPASELVNQSIPLDAVLGRHAGALAARLGQVPGWSDRFAFLDTWLASRLRPERASDGPLMPAWWRLQHPAARPTIGGLAAELGLSRRGLQLGFQRHIGLPPRLVARIARFQHAMYRLSRPGSRLAAAAAYGFADQPHFNREVRAMSGLTPTELFAFIQDAEGNPG